jgi:pilus assembly protein Flp/PilA
MRIHREERGQGLVEYALILALVSLAAILALSFLSGKINGLFSKAGNSLNAVSVASGGGTPPPPAPPGNGTPISASNSNPFNNASGLYYAAGQIEVCSPNSGLNLVACLLGGGNWATVNEEGVYAQIPFTRTGACSFTYTSTGYAFSGSWEPNEAPYRVISGDNSPDFGEACFP